MYSGKIESLIKSVTADGNISDKEREVLHRAAQRENIDIDEMDVYVDGIIDQLKNETTRASVHKHGDVEKCPSCGALVNSRGCKM